MIKGKGKQNNERFIPVKEKGKWVCIKTSETLSSVPEKEYVDDHGEGIKQPLST